MGVMITLDQAQKGVLMPRDIITSLNGFSVVQQTVKANHVNQFLRIVRGGWRDKVKSFVTIAMKNYYTTPCFC